MSIEIQDFSNTVQRISPGYSGQSAADQFNTAISQIEAHLTSVAGRVSNLNTKSGIIRKNVPMAATVFVGALVYFNTATGHARFEPALAELAADPGSQGQSIETARSRVEGIVISIDSSADTSNTVLGTLLTGGYWESTSVVTGCLGSAAAAIPGTYYLSPTTAGKAVSDPGQHLRQPLLSNYGNGKFSLNIFYMAHDNHFHGSCALSGGTWTAATTPPTGVTAPAGATYWYNGTGDSGYAGLGELTSTTTAVFYQGELQYTQMYFVLASGYLWTKMATAPAAGTVTLFNHFPFAYGSPVLRSIEAEDDTLSITTHNGRVVMKAHDFVSGSAAYSAYAVSSISGNTVNMTPVVSGVFGGPGVTVSHALDGSVILSSSSQVGVPVDAYSINHNSTNMTSDGRFMYLVFPKGRTGASMNISLPISDIPSSMTMKAYVWGTCVEASASFNISYYWLPQPTASTRSTIPQSAAATGTLAFSGASGQVSYAESSSSLQFQGSGTMVATVTVSGTPSDDIRLMRLGFRLEAVSNTAEQQTSTSQTSVTAIINEGVTAAAVTKYAPVRGTSSGTLRMCYSNTAADCGTCIGIAVETGLTGTSIRYMLQGVIQDTSFAFTPGNPVYISPTGTLTQTSPATDVNALYIQRIGIALTATVIQVDIEPAVMKEA